MAEQAVASPVYPGYNLVFFVERQALEEGSSLLEIRV